MNRGIYTGARGMMATSQWMDVLANNLANAITDGYKKDTLGFTDVLRQRQFASGGRGNFVGSLSEGPSSTLQSVDKSVGTMKSTGNPLDVALDSEIGMFSVMANGQVMYTRDGSFKVNSNQELVTSQGHNVLDDRGNKITFQGTGKLEISPNGEVLEGGQSIAKLGIFDGAFNKAGGNLWSGNRPTALTDAKLLVGNIEGSNVQPIEAMVDLIKINRSYELSQKSIQNQDELTSKLIETINRH
jgi:flagellar basal body rod protein FlgG